MSIFDNPLSYSSNTVWRERRAFAYYFQHAAPFVGGDLDVDFWSTIVPQVCRSEPAVWDAIISISALFESREPWPKAVLPARGYPRTLNQNHRDALSWYSRAVSAVRQRIERGAVDIFVGLISCVLFICIECLQGAAAQALQLYRQGVQLIVDLRAKIACGVVPSFNVSLLEDTIVPIFVRLGAIAISVSPVPVSDLLQDTGHASTHKFVSLKRAREAIVLLATEVQLFDRICSEHLLKPHPSHVPQKLVNQQRALSARLKSWHTAFIKLMESLHTKDILSPQETSTAAILYTYHEMLFILVAICVSPLQIITDAYLPNFQNIVEQSSIALDSSAQSDGTQPPFTFGISVGLPLWFTCLRCREPRIRRRALALLNRAPRVQGFYMCDTTVTVCEKVITLEETHGMAMKATQETTNSLSPDSTHLSSDCQYHSRCNSSDIYRFDLSSPLTVPNSESPASPYSMLTDMKTKTPTAILVPEEARIAPMGVFRPGDGFPPGARDEDIAKWNQCHDQEFLGFWRNQRDLSSDTWRKVYGYAPIDF
ncbi:hypothetical protein BBP40_009628 [Aspergillus hancockii]|nr:hypothetical protein BBP40_009628 [Aspergillus hancockii]